VHKDHRVQQVLEVHKEDKEPKVIRDIEVLKDHHRILDLRITSKD